MAALGWVEPLRVAAFRQVKPSFLVHTHLNPLFPLSHLGLCLLFPRFFTADLFPLTLGTFVLEASRSSLVFSPDEAFSAPFCWVSGDFLTRVFLSWGPAFLIPHCLSGVLPLHVFLQPLIFLKLADMHGGPTVQRGGCLGTARSVKVMKTVAGQGGRGQDALKGPCVALTVRYGSL